MYQSSLETNDAEGFVDCYCMGLYVSTSIHGIYSIDDSYNK